MLIDMSIIAFISMFVAKITGYIDWSWWWILLPAWGWIVFWVGAGVIMIISLLIGYLLISK
jgi:hypothetical protein